MNQDQIDNINYSWGVISLEPGAMLSFYDRLFEIAPETKHYFATDLTKQSEKLAYTIGFVVGNLERMDEIRGAVEDLGRFHNKLKIKAEYYGYVKTALIDTIKRIMAKSYNEDIGNSWDVALTQIATMMINAPEKREPRLKKLLAKMFGKA